MDGWWNWNGKPLSNWASFILGNYQIQSAKNVNIDENVTCSGGRCQNFTLNHLPVDKYAILLLLSSLWCMHFMQIYISPHKRTRAWELETFVITYYKFWRHILSTFYNHINPIESNSGGAHVLDGNILWVCRPLMWYLSVETGGWKKGMTSDKDVMVTDTLIIFYTHPIN